MLTALLIMEEGLSAAAIEDLATGSNLIRIEKTFHRMPSPYEAVTLLNTHRPDVVLLGLRDDPAYLELATRMVEHEPNLAIVAVAGTWVRPWSARVEQAGVTALLIEPVQPSAFEAAISNAVRLKNQEELPKVVCFLPAKAGSGATTAALHVAGYSSSLLNRKAALVEGDLHSGVLAELLKLRLRIPMRDLLCDTQELDPTRLHSASSQAHGMDVFLTDRTRKLPVPHWMHYFNLLRLMSFHYDLVVVDLPEVVNEATSEVVRRSSHVYIVSTPEVGPVKLAQQRLRELDARGVRNTKIEIVLNRWHKTDPSPEDVTQSVGRPVAATLRNDYLGVRKAQESAELVPPDTLLGQGYLTFARKLAGLADTPDEPKRGSFFSRLSRKQTA